MNEVTAVDLTSWLGKPIAAATSAPITTSRCWPSRTTRGRSAR
jgi:hypothetical protein